MDGNSTDGTIEEAKKLGFDVIQQKGDGLGDAYREAVKHATSENILFFSPDGNAPPEYIPKLIKKMNDNVDIPLISEKTEEKILNAIWDSVEEVVKEALIED